MKSHVKMQWLVAEEPDFRFVEELASKVDLPPLIVKILVSRGVKEADDIDRFIKYKIVFESI